MLSRQVYPPERSIRGAPMQGASQPIRSGTTVPDRCGAQWHVLNGFARDRIRLTLIERSFLAIRVQEIRQSTGNEPLLRTGVILHADPQVTKMLYGWACLRQMSKCGRMKNAPKKPLPKQSRDTSIAKTRNELRYRKASRAEHIHTPRAINREGVRMSY